jgi:hypothetical protein
LRIRGVRVALVPSAWRWRFDILGPYGQHLLSDPGELYLGFAVLFVWAARPVSLTLVRASCTAFALTKLMHFLSHVTHLARLDVGSVAAQASGLVLMLGLPVGGLIATDRSEAPVS